MYRNAEILNVSNLKRDHNLQSQQVGEIMKPRRKWEELGVSLHPEIKTAIETFNFPTMTPVQAATIPLLLNMKDVAAEAVTGIK